MSLDESPMVPESQSAKDSRMAKKLLDRRELSEALLFLREASRRLMDVGNRTDSLSLICSTSVNSLGRIILDIELEAGRDK